MDHGSTKIFLLSPANMGGVRAQQLTSSQSRFELARSFRSVEGVTIEEAFCFMSSLYFRGKLIYARQFVATPDASPNSRILIIAPGFGLVSPDWRLTTQRTHVNVLSPIFGNRLFAPRSFVGIGDMSRGALLLRSAMSRTELEYMPLNFACLRTRRRTSASFNGAQDLPLSKTLGGPTES
jgi:hypothetical protein